MSKAGNTVVISASMIAAIRLAREDNLRNSPKLVSTISDSVNIAYLVYRRVKQDHPELFREENTGS